MKEINQFLKKETREFRRKSINGEIDIKYKKLQEEKKKLQVKYDKWLITLKELFKTKLYRQVVREIEEKKYLYKILAETEFWKIKLIKAKAILKIIKIKMVKHQKDVFLENSIQNLSLKFWFNQIFLTLEELCLEFRFDLNKHMNPNSKELLVSIQSLAEAHLEFIYYLCLFSIKTGEVIPLLTYISNSDKLMQYIKLLVNPKIYNLFLDILLIKIKLLIQNCNYIPALDSVQNFFRLFFQNLIFFLDYESQITPESLNNPRKKDKRRNAGLCDIMLKLIIAYYLRGVISEHLGFYKNSIKAYQQCRWFSDLFMPNFNKFVFKFFKNMEKTYILYYEIFEDIDQQFEIKHNKNKHDKKNKSQKLLGLKRKNFLNKSMINLGYKRVKTMKYQNYKNLKKVSSVSGMSKKYLEKLLNQIGKNMYKEEENRNNNIFNKFGPNNFVLSTVDMVNNLLSKPFRPILRKMDKIEVTKPQEEISYLINKTLNIKRRNEFKVEMEKRAKNHKKNSHALHRNKSNLSDFTSSTNVNLKFYHTSFRQKIKLKQQKDKNRDDKSKENNRYNQSCTTGIKNNFLISSMKNNGFKIESKSVVKSYNKIDKYSPDKDVFSKSLQKKKKYLDSFYQKELLFQKKLLKLKANDSEKVKTEDYNPKQVVKEAEQDFNIIKCFAESKNAKKNLINLVGENQLKNLELMMGSKGRMRTNKKRNLLNINSLNNFMKLNHISQIRIKYDPNNAAKNNEEKTRLLTMECAHIEDMQNQCQIQKEILRNEIFGIKSKNNNRYKIK